MSLLFHFHQKFYHAITDTRKMFPVWAEIAIPGFLLFYIFLSFWKQIKAFFSDTSAFLSAPPVTPFAIFRLIICILRATHLSTYPFCSSSTSIKKGAYRLLLPIYALPDHSVFLFFLTFQIPKGTSCPRTCQQQQEHPDKGVSVVSCLWSIRDWFFRFFLIWFFR